MPLNKLKVGEIKKQGKKAHALVDNFQNFCSVSVQRTFYFKFNNCITLVLVLFHKAVPQVLQGASIECGVCFLLAFSLSTEALIIITLWALLVHVILTFFLVCACPHSSFNHGETIGACGRFFLWPLLSIRTQWEYFSMGNLTALHMGPSDLQEF